ncbi:hypothetical protein M9H77_05903 [Catharanthus roseus]|uniref:Uncharacterized protein n=1 Tax=Catharanthus roseus TaxID=4058 RepID=A0ACC0BR06_CATRO|nr:hypothetical protein M9H77_05903 [Catharanthus roseus]
MDWATPKEDGLKFIGLGRANPTGPSLLLAAAAAVAGAVSRPSDCAPDLLVKERERSSSLRGRSIEGRQIGPHCRSRCCWLLVLPAASLPLVSLLFGCSRSTSQQLAASQRRLDLLMHSQVTPSWSHWHGLAGEEERLSAEEEEGPKSYFVIV